MDMKAIASKLADRLVNSRMTFEDLALKTDIPKSALHRYLTGETEKIPLDRFQQICAALDLDAAELLGWRHTEDGIGYEAVKPKPIHRQGPPIVPEQYTIDDDENTEHPMTKDKIEIYKALSELGHVNIEAAVTLFRSMIKKDMI